MARCGEGRFFVSIVILLSDSDKFLLQLYLRELLLLNSSMAVGRPLDDLDPELRAKYVEMVQLIKYSIILVATAPIFCVYPFIQKYFVKGVMIGSVKG